MMWFVVVYSDFTARRYSARKTPCSHQTPISANNGSDCCVHFCAPIKALHFRNRFEFTLKDWLKLRKLAASYLSRIRQKVAFFSTSAGSAATRTVVSCKQGLMINLYWPIHGKLIDGLRSNGNGRVAAVLAVSSSAVVSLVTMSLKPWS